MSPEVIKGQILRNAIFVWSFDVNYLKNYWPTKKHAIALEMLFHYDVVKIDRTSTVMIWRSGKAKKAFLSPKSK